MKTYNEFLNEEGEGAFTGTASLPSFNPVLGTIQKRKELTEDDNCVDIVYTDNISTMYRWTLDDKKGNTIKGENGYSVNFRTKKEAEEYANSNGFTIGEYKNVDWSKANENL
ncbi:MAG: hypothetical protein WC679_01320 [Bacteroidales bacterium]|jgi:hypothetical protein